MIELLFIDSVMFSIFSMLIASHIATRFQNKMTLAEIFVFTAQILCTILFVVLLIFKVDIF